MTRRTRVNLLFSRSAAARRAAASADLLKAEIATEGRRVVPVARFARLCGISERLAWQWVAAGLITKNREGKAGLLRGSVVGFLKLLREADEFFEYAQFHSQAGRPVSAMRKIPSYLSRDAKVLQGMNPRQAAVHLGVSRGTILRAIRHGRLESYRPTPHRILIGRKPRKKVSVSAKKT